MVDQGRGDNSIGPGTHPHSAGFPGGRRRATSRPVPVGPSRPIAGPGAVFLGDDRLPAVTLWLDITAGGT